MRKIGHWTPTYIYDRLAVIRYEKKHPDAPWITASMISILEDWLRPADVGLEFGSGRSTVWFASRVARLTSVEHNPVWHEIVSKRLAAKMLQDRVDYRLCDDGLGDTADTRYAKVVGEFQVRSLDFVFVDGRSRDHIALASLEKIKPGGALIIDNINWYIPHSPKPRSPASRDAADGCASPVWGKVVEQVKGWRLIWTTNGVSDTALWTKPCTA
jgi:predicted O-methyltransferase YrrM